MSKLPKVGEFKLSRYNRIQNASHRKTRVLDFTVTPEYLWELYVAQGRKCALSGVTLIDINRASLDRIDSNRGYLPGNVQWVTAAVNISKGTLTQDGFIGWCHAIYEGMRERHVQIN